MSNLPASRDVPSRSLCAGDRVGSYLIEAAIADGGMGEVYRARHVILPRVAAIKVLHPDQVGVDAASQRMLQEARVLESMASLTAVKVFDVGMLDDGRPWVAMELIEGQTLSAYLETRGALPPDEVGELLLGLVDALAPAHARGIIHRDVKPENVMLAQRDGRRVVRLIDWGIARILDAGVARITQLDATPGTPHYMAPEQIRGDAIDGRTDVYSLGVLAFELLAGDTPYRGATSLEVIVQHLTAEAPSVAAQCPGVPPALERLILAMMAKSPASRPSLERIRDEIGAMLVALSDGADGLVELEIELDLDDVLSELTDEDSDPRAELVAAAAATWSALPTTRARTRWTPPLGTMVRGDLRRGGVVLGATTQAGEIAVAH